MVVGAKVCELTDGFLWFVCGLYVGILTSPLIIIPSHGHAYTFSIVHPAEFLGRTAAGRTALKYG